jgi:uncharacterized protein YceH (UPF0502 family)
VLTPDLYPLTLNALTLACNQKSSRDPVLSLEPGVVENAARQLEAKRLLSVDENMKGRVRRYTQRFCNTPFAEVQLSREEFAVMCVLLLRGRQTPGEVRSRAGRLAAFSDNDAVAAALQGLIDRSTPLAVRLPRLSGRQDSQYMHLLCGPVAVAEDAVLGEATGIGARGGSDRISALESRLDALESELQEIRQVLAWNSEDAVEGRNPDGS